MRVLDLIIERCEGTAEAVETPIGYVPNSINTEGIEDEVTPEIMEKLLYVDKDLWKEEVANLREFYKQFGDRLPAEITKQLDNLEARLNK